MRGRTHTVFTGKSHRFGVSTLKASLAWMGVTTTSRLSSVEKANGRASNVWRDSITKRVLPFKMTSKIHERTVSLSLGAMVQQDDKPGMKPVNAIFSLFGDFISQGRE